MCIIFYYCIILLPEENITMSNERKRLSGSGYRKEAQKKAGKQREASENTTKIYLMKK